MKKSLRYLPFILAACTMPTAAWADSDSDTVADSVADTISDAVSDSINDAGSDTLMVNNAPASETIATGQDVSKLSESKKIEQLDFAIAMGTIALRRGDIFNAKQHIKYGLSFKDDDSQLWYLNGLIASAEGIWQEAIDSFIKTKQLDDKKDISYELANAYFNVKDFEKANETIANCNSASCQLLKGLIQIDSRQYEEAVLSFAESAKISQESDISVTLPANFYGAATKLSLGKFKEARATLDQSYQLSKNGSPWDMLYAGLKRNLQLFNFTGSLGLHFDSNIANISEAALVARKENGQSNLADLFFDVNLAGNFRYFFTQKIKLNVNLGFNQKLHLLEGPETRKYNMTNLTGGVGLAFGWGARPTLNNVEIVYNISSAWALGEAHKNDVGLAFFGLNQEVGPAVNLTIGSRGNLNTGIKLLIANFDDSAFIPELSADDKNARDALGPQIHALYMHKLANSFSIGALANGGYVNAKSDEYDRGFFGANLLLNWMPTYRGGVSGAIGYGLYSYDHSSSDRFDNQLDVAFRIGSLLNKFMNIGIDVNYTHRWSTVQYYEYDRILVGLNLAFTL